MRLSMLHFVMACIFVVTVQAQSSDLSEVKAEITTAALQEQQAFKNGDCDTVLSLMEEEITFLANGRRVPSKAVVGKFCNSLPRPFKPAVANELMVYPLTESSGYTIRSLTYGSDEKKMQEFVTKIWRKKEDAWKITHLHSTVKPIISSK